MRVAGPSCCSGGPGVSAQPEGAGPHLILHPHQEGGSGPKQVPGAGTPWLARSARPLSGGPSTCRSCAPKHRRARRPTCTTPMAITHMQNRKMPRGTSGKVTIKENCSQKDPQHQGPCESTGPRLGHCGAVKGGGVSATGPLGLKFKAFKA